MSYIKPIFYVKDGLKFSAWHEAFPNAINSSSYVQSTDINLVFVWAGLSSWKELITKSKDNDLQILVLGYETSTAELQEAFRLGASGYLGLTSSVNTLQEAAEAVMNNNYWLPQDMIRSLIKIINKVEPKSNDNLDKLTAREREVAEGICEGLSNKAIAIKLEITERTVKQHLANIFEKLGVKDRVQLALKCTR